jgi:hypothetical protein
VDAAAEGEGEGGGEGESQPPPQRQQAFRRASTAPSPALLRALGISVGLGEGEGAAEDLGGSAKAGVVNVPSISAAQARARRGTMFGDAWTTGAAELAASAAPASAASAAAAMDVDWVVDVRVGRGGGPDGDQAGEWFFGQATAYLPPAGDSSEEGSVLVQVTSAETGQELGSVLPVQQWRHVRLVEAGAMDGAKGGDGERKANEELFEQLVFGSTIEVLWEVEVATAKGGGGGGGGGGAEGGSSGALDPWAAASGEEELQWVLAVATQYVAATNQLRIRAADDGDGCAGNGGDGTRLVDADEGVRLLACEGPPHGNNSAE